VPLSNHRPDPFTHAKRKREFRPTDGKHIPREQVIKHIDSTHAGTNLRLVPRIIRAPKKVRILAEKAGLDKRQTLKKQEQLVSRLVSKWVDHMISGMKEKELIAHNISKREERKLWLQFYNNFIDQFFLKKDSHITNKNGKLIFATKILNDPAVREERNAIITEMDQAISYTLPPKYIIERRDKKQKYSLRAWSLIRSGVNPEENLENEVQRILRRRYSRIGRPYTQEQVIQAKAVQICLAASIYADILERTKGENWISAYGLGMMQMHSVIEKRPRIEHEIRNLDKVEIKD